ncbi:MAG: AmmeMemoRadiSam system radical SAM enzyme [Candidatus Methanomethylicia archaeon]
MVKEAYFYNKLKNNIVQCIICPRKCIVKPGSRGFCNTRENRDGKLYSLIYGRVSAMSVDPIEKKPLFHFWPGSPTFSISSVGCSFKCPWCQNWHLSQPGKIEDVYTEYIPPEDIVVNAKNRGCPSISITYNEPIIWLEYDLDIAKIAKAEGLKIIFVTNGYISIDALNEVAKYIDAVNVDVKGFTEEFYHKYCQADLKGVLEATAEMKNRGIHVETTTLLIPGLNDSTEELENLCKWHYDTLGPETPIHFSRFFPHFKFTSLLPTPIKTLVKAREIALNRGLRYVYVGNIPGHEGENTYCPNCKNPVIERVGFEITGWRLNEEMRCLNCNEKIPIIGKYDKKYKWYYY